MYNSVSICVHNIQCYVYAIAIEAGGNSLLANNLLRKEKRKENKIKKNEKKKKKPSYPSSVSPLHKFFPCIYCLSFLFKYLYIRNNTTRQSPKTIQYSLTALSIKQAFHGFDAK